MIRLGEITHRPVLSCARGEGMAWTWGGFRPSRLQQLIGFIIIYLHANNNYHIPTNNNTQPTE